MIKKRVKAGIIAAVLAVSAFLATRNTGWAKGTDPYSISGNDLSITTGEVGIATCTYSDAWVCPTNSAYYVNAIFKLDEDWNSVKFTDDEWEAFRARVEAQNPEDGSDEILQRYGRGYQDIYSVNYLSKEVTVVDGSTRTTIPSKLGSLDTYFFIDARKPSGEWEYFPEMKRFSPDYTFSWSDYLSDEYVYYVLYTTECDTDSNSGIKRFFVAEDKLDAMRAMIPAATISDVRPSIEEGVEGSMYRLYNPNSGEHFYTAKVEEARGLKRVGWYYEDVAWIAPTSSNTPVYRIYNPNSGEHHYTMNAAEKDNLVSLGWNDEGIGWYSDDNQGTPLYRLYNPNATGQYEAGGHHYTKDTAEKNRLIQAGWQDEGIGWYGI